MKKIILGTFLTVATLNVSAKDTAADTLTVTTTPQMHCSGCESKIKQNIRFVKGVKRITTSVADQKVTIVYDPKKSTYDDFVAAFKKIGYSIRKADD